MPTSTKPLKPMPPPDVPMVDPDTGRPTRILYDLLQNLRDMLAGVAPAAAATNAVITTSVATPSFGLLIVRDATNAKVGIYRMEGTALTAISADAEFNTTKDHASTVNVYAESGAIKLQNKTAGSLNLTATYYGV